VISLMTQPYPLTGTLPTPSTRKRLPLRLRSNGLGEINGDLIETDPSFASILARLLAFFQRGEPVGMYDE
jgi:hypothetical protein